MDWAEIHRRVQSATLAAAALLVVEVPLMWLGLFAGAFALGVWLFLVIAFDVLLFSRLFEHLIISRIPAWHSARLRYCYILVALFALATAPMMKTIADVAYQTGQFGEPPGNRYLVERRPNETTLVLEFGVETTPLGTGSGVVVRFNRDNYLLRGAWFNITALLDPAPSKQPIGSYRSGGADRDSKVFLFEPGHDAITPNQSLVLEFTSPESGLNLEDCVVRDFDESIQQGKGCLSGDVRWVKER
jgi:hypothetical protein